MRKPNGHIDRAPSRTKKGRVVPAFSIEVSAINGRSMMPLAHPDFARAGRSELHQWWI